jgi:hypothetical protein
MANLLWNGRGFALKIVKKRAFDATEGLSRLGGKYRGA